MIILIIKLSYKDFDVRLNPMRVSLMLPCMLDQDVFFEVPDKMCGVVATSDIIPAVEKISNKYHQADYNELEGEWYVYFE